MSLSVVNVTGVCKNLRQPIKAARRHPLGNALFENITENILLSLYNVQNAWLNYMLPSL